MTNPAQHERRSTLNRHVHALAALLDMDHDTLSDFACDCFEVDSMTKITIRGLRTLRDRLDQEVQKINRLSQQQFQRICGLGYKTLGWDGHDIKKFIQRQISRWKGIQDLTSPEANKVITGMEKVAMDRGLIRNG